LKREVTSQTTKQNAKLGLSRFPKLLKDWWS